MSLSTIGGLAGYFRPRTAGRNRNEKALHRAGRRPGVIFVLTTSLIAAAADGHGQAAPNQFAYRARDLESLRSGFAHPPQAAGPWVHWFWFDGMLSAEEIARQIEELAVAGFAGAEIRCVTFNGWGGDPLPATDRESLARLGHRRVKYLSDEFIELLVVACAEAKEQGLRLAINMGQGWPPGGPWITDEHRTKHLTAQPRVVAGPATFSVSDLPQHGYALAWQLRDNREEVIAESFVDLTSRIKTTDGRRELRWEAPSGRWLIGLFGIVPGGIADKGDGPEVDPASREAVLFHLEHLFGRLDPALETYYGEVLVDVASDSWEYHHGPGRYWSDALPRAYNQLTGNDLSCHLHALLGYGPGVAEVLANVQQTEQRLVEENFFGTVAEFLHQRNLGHRPQVYGRGLAREFFSAYALADTPEVEHGIILPEAPWTAHLTSKPVVSAEAFTFLSLKHDPVRHRNGPWESTPSLLRWHANHFFAEGVNRIQFHSYSYTPAGLPPPGWRMYAEIHLNRDVPWWEWTSELTRWLARNQWILQSGKHATETLVYPVEANQREGPYNQRLLKQPVSAANGIDAASRELMPRLLAEQQLRELEFKNLLLLDAPSTAEEAAQLLQSLPDGGTLLSTVSAEQWRRMQNESGGPQLERLRHQLLESGRFKQVPNERWREALRQQTTVRWTPAEGDLRYQHRRISDAEVYFIVNAGHTFFGEATFPHACKLAERWDADSGRVAPVATMRRDGQTTTIPIDLAHFESTIISFSEGKMPLHAIEAPRVDVARRGNRLVAIAERSGEYRATLSNGVKHHWKVDIPHRVSLRGPWLLAPFESTNERDARHAIDVLVSWRELAGFKRFAGRVVYETDFEMSPQSLSDRVRWTLELGRVHETASVWLNDNLVGAAWSPPFRVDVSEAIQPGRNELRVGVANLLKNRLESSDNYRRPSGLLGPVQLIPFYVEDLGD